jgi:hypothetical protein
MRKVLVLNHTTSGRTYAHVLGVSAGSWAGWGCRVAGVERTRQATVQVYLRHAFAHAVERETVAWSDEVIMALILDRNGHAVASVRHVSVSQVLVTMLGAGMMTLVIVPLLLGIAIQQRTVVPPQLNVRLGGLHLLGYAAHTPDCPQYPCRPEVMGSPAQDYYIIWVLPSTRQLPSADAWLTGTRLLKLPLQNPFNELRDR